MNYKLFHSKQNRFSPHYSPQETSKSVFLNFLNLPTGRWSGLPLFGLWCLARFIGSGISRLDLFFSFRLMDLGELKIVMHLACFMRDNSRMSIKNYFLDGICGISLTRERII